jgi:prepilin-type N-terminal cleavage/methylation domain-containing protein
MTHERTGAPEPTGVDSGFSLIEVLVSIALLAMILVGLPEALRLGRRGLEVSKEVDRNSEIQAGLAFLEQRLVQIMPLYRHGDDGRLQIFFRGARDAATFISPSPAGPGGGGLYRFELRATAFDNGEGAIFLGWSPYVPNAIEAVPENFEERVLIKGIRQYEFRYYGRHKDKDKASWGEDWDRTDALPDLIEVRSTFPDAPSHQVIVAELRLSTSS